MPHTASKPAGMIYGDHLKDARVHCVVLKVRAVPSPTCQQRRQTRKGPEVSSGPTFRSSTSGPSGPNSVHVRDPTPPTFPAASSVLSVKPHPSHLVNCSTHELPVENVCLESGAWTPSRGCQMLLRKEVIQPHLPVRLPCYDLVLITDPTFDGSLPKGLGHRLQVLPTFMT